MKIIAQKTTMLEWIRSFCFNRKLLLMHNYIIKFRNSQIYRWLFSFLPIIFILSLFFPIRHTFITPEAYLTGDYSDFTAFSLYLSDIIIFTTWFLLILPRGREFYHVVKPLKWLILVVFLSFIIHFGTNTRLSSFFLVKWLELIVAYGTLVIIFRETTAKSSFLKLFAWMCGLQSILALVQFWKQSSIGLFRLGEPHLSPTILGVAKLVSGGTRFIRAYGTFPHPNPFSAFLLVGVLISFYLLFKSDKSRNKLTYSFLLSLNIIGLALTFSRGAYLALAIGLVVMVGYLIFTKTKGLAFPVLIVLLSILFSFIILKPFLLTRATFSDQSTVDRKFYDVTGVKMAEQNPIFGIGLGESLLHMEQYSGKTLSPWDKQPPHNYFIIAAAELGFPAAVILLWIFFNHLWPLIKNFKLKIKNSDSAFHFLLFTILICFLILMQFDHYFYTLQQTQLLLWTVLALISSEISHEKNTKQI